jgi:hypothetical protein
MAEQVRPVWAPATHWRDGTPKSDEYGNAPDPQSLKAASGQGWAKPRLHECTRCGKPDVAENLLYSSHTRKRYCLDFATCDRRARRKGLL